MKEVRLRLAGMEDADRLLAWRNDEATRLASHNSAMIGVADHLNWLRSALNSDMRRLYIAEKDHRAVGTLRADVVEGQWLLSWTVAPQERGKGVAQQMLACIIEELKAPLLAQVKVGNMASIKVAERAGFRLQKEINGVLFYRHSGRPNLVH